MAWEVNVVIAGKNVTALVRLASLTITDTLNEQPNTATLTVNTAMHPGHPSLSGGFELAAFDAGAFDTAPKTSEAVPDILAGQVIRIYQGPLEPASCIFGGEIVARTQVYEGDRPALVAVHLSCIDFTRALNRRKVSKTYGTESATAIVADLMASRGADGFTTDAVALDLPPVAIEFTFEDMNRALTRLANRIGGYWYVDYFQDLHFFLSEAADPPAPIVVGERFADLQQERDLSQVRTRVYVEGLGSTSLAIIEPGQTSIPVLDPSPFAPGGGWCVAGPQRIQYTGLVTPIEAGTLVGPGVQPTVAPGLVSASGTGIEAGPHGYAFTFVTAAGESLPSPTSTIEVGLVTPPAAPTVGTPTAGGNVPPGSHEYAVTCVTPTGETTPGPASAPRLVTPLVSTPTIAPNTYGYDDPDYPGDLVKNADYQYVYTWATASGETTPSPASVPERTSTGAISVNAPHSKSTAVTKIRVYRTAQQNGLPFRFIDETTNNAASEVMAQWYDDTADSARGVNAPASNTSTNALVPLTQIAIGPPLVTARKVYRRTNGTGAFLLVATIANNTATTASDTAASGGAAAPSTNTATGANQVTVTIATSPSGSVTARRIYRTVANGSQLKRLTEMSNNTATSYLDAAADATLGVNGPTSDTSGLTQPTGQVNAGATTMPVAGVAPFAPGGGWAVIGNGAQAIRYGGVSAGQLTGIPSSGTGAIRATVGYNSTITVAPTLTGIPASGAGAIVETIPEGEEIHLLVIRDDPAAQAALAALEGGDGVIEHYIQDRRLTASSCENTAAAELELFKTPEVRVRYTTHDARTRTGKTVAIALPAPTNLTGDFLIQRVQLSQFGIPGRPCLRTVEASSTRFSFEDVLRRLAFEVEA